MRRVVYNVSSQSISVSSGDVNNSTVLEVVEGILYLPSGTIGDQTSSKKSKKRDRKICSLTVTRYKVLFNRFPKRKIKMRNRVDDGD